MGKHKRREGHWKYYEPVRREKRLHVKRTLSELIRGNSHPRGRSGRGRQPIHFKEKMDFACLWMMTWDHALRDTEVETGQMRDMWDGPASDHALLSGHMREVDTDWRGPVLAETARRCPGAPDDGTTAPLGSDSSGVETGRHG